jgi:hypothetical protein
MPVSEENKERVKAFLQKPWDNKELLAKVTGYVWFLTEQNKTLLKWIEDDLKEPSSEL